VGGKRGISGFISEKSASFSEYRTDKAANIAGEGMSLSLTEVIFPLETIFL
jgi:hypothetical protein